MIQTCHINIPQVSRDTLWCVGRGQQAARRQGVELGGEHSLLRCSLSANVLGVLAGLGPQP